jgi:hypothetical protein
VPVPPLLRLLKSHAVGRSCASNRAAHGREQQQLTLSSRQRRPAERRGRVERSSQGSRDGALSNRLLSAGKWQKNSTRFCPAA